jgi:hypothetical protein
MSSTQRGLPTLSLSANTKNRIIRQPTHFTYDNAGNLTSEGAYAYAWDAKEQGLGVRG